MAATARQLGHATDHGSAQDTAYAWRVLSVTSLGVLLTGLNTSTLDVALPVVARHFRAGATAASWLLLGYMLVVTVLILAFGRLADIVGRRRLYLAGLATLTLASLAAGLSPDVGVLIGMRALQAVGAAAVITNTTALLTDAFPAARLSMGLGLNVTTAAGAQVLGPLVGGLVATTWGWRAVFWFNVPIGIVGIGWAGLTLRRPPTSPRREPFDLAGAALSLAVVGCLVTALSEGGAIGWTAPVVLAAAGGFMVLTPLFVHLQRVRRFPLVDTALFADRERTFAFLAAFLLSVARFAVVLLAALYVQAARGSDAFHAGLQVLPVAGGMMLASPVAGRLAGRYPARILSTAGLAVTGLGLLALGLTLSPTLSPVLLGLPLAAVGAGSGLFMTPNTSAIMSSVPPERRGIANGLRSMLQNTGYVTSTALSLAIVTSPLGAGEKAAAYAGRLSRLPGADLAAFTGGYHRALLLLAATTAVGAVASLLRNPPRAAR